MSKIEQYKLVAIAVYVILCGMAVSAFSCLVFLELIS